MVLCFRTFCLLLQSTSSASFRVLSRQHPLICSKSLSKFVTYRAAARHQFSSPKCQALTRATFGFRGHGTLVQVTHGHAPICRLLLRCSSRERASRASRSPPPPSLAGKLRASISLLIALIRDRGGVNWKTLVLCLFGGRKRQ